MSVKTAIDEYGKLRPERESRGRELIRLPEKLSELLILAAGCMAGLDRKLYFPNWKSWHKGGGEGELCEINFAGAVMATELGAPREWDLAPHAYVSERGYMNGLNAVEAVASRMDVRDGVLYAAGREEFYLPWDGKARIYADFDANATPDQAGLVAKWNQRAALSHKNAEKFGEWHDCAGRGYYGWAQAELVQTALRDVARELKAVGW